MTIKVRIPIPHIWLNMGDTFVRLSTAELHIASLFSVASEFKCVCISGVVRCVDCGYG